LQALAYPADLSDPLLRKWTKFSGNPVLRAPPTIPIDVFRDPSSGWIGGDGKWRMSIGSRLGREGLALLYTSVDFVHWKYIEKPLFSVAGTGMWECFDFYPLAPLGKPGLNDSVHGPGIKHLLKASLQDDRHDWYGLGQYNTEADTFIPDDPANPIGLRYNYGKFFASKSFFDPVKQRRIIWGFINESDPEANDIVKGWNTVLVSFNTFSHVPCVWRFSFTWETLICSSLSCHK
jgi:beta-fructofuranosidase